MFSFGTYMFRFTFRFLFDLKFILVNNMRYRPSLIFFQMAIQLSQVFKKNNSILGIFWGSRGQDSGCTTARGMSSIPGQGTKIPLPLVVQQGQNKNKNKKTLNPTPFLLNSSRLSQNNNFKCAWIYFWTSYSFLLVCMLFMHQEHNFFL